MTQPDSYTEEQLWEELNARLMRAAVSLGAMVTASFIGDWEVAEDYRLHAEQEWDGHADSGIGLSLWDLAEAYPESSFRMVRAMLEWWEGFVELGLSGERPYIWFTRD